MITKRISKEDILAKLKGKITERKPIMISSAGSGLVAKLLEEAGADCINTFSGARLRANGMGTMSMMWPILDSNQQTLDYTREDIMPAMAGSSSGITLQNEIDMLILAKEMNMVTIGLAFSEEDSIALVGQAKPHIFCYHAGTTKGGRTGYDKGMTINETAEETESVFQKIREISPDVILVGHGAAMENPPDAKFMLDNTSCHGFWTGS